MRNNQDLNEVFNVFEKLNIYTKEQIEEIRNTKLLEFLNTKFSPFLTESELDEVDRDMYTAGGEVSIDKIQQLCDIFHNPKYTVTPGTFAYLCYISEVKLNKGYNYTGWSNSKGETFDKDALEKMGRDLGKEYLGKFYDSDAYKNGLYNSRLRSKNKVSNPYAIFRVTSQTFNWGAMKYGESLNNQHDTIINASEEDLNDYIKNDSRFKKHLEAYFKLHPESQEEIEVMIDKGILDREAIHEIYRTPIAPNRSKWDKVNDYFSQNSSTGNFGIRLTHTPDMVKSTIKTKYFMVTEQKLYRISEEEFWHLSKMFGPSQSQDEVTHTNLGDVLQAISDGTKFNNYTLNQIISISFKMNNTVTGQQADFKFVNNEVSIPKTDIVMSADEIMQAPVTV